MSTLKLMVAVIALQPCFLLVAAWVGYRIALGGVREGKGGK